MGGTSLQVKFILGAIDMGGASLQVLFILGQFLWVVFR